MCPGFVDLHLSFPPDPWPSLKVMSLPADEYCITITVIVHNRRALPSAKKGLYYQPHVGDQTSNAGIEEGCCGDCYSFKIAPFPTKIVLL
jgi:hypothetical protein